jgi:hypothetical protein
MRNLQRRWVGVLVGSVMTLSGCTYAAIQRLSLEERAEFHIYQKVMPHHKSEPISPRRPLRNARPTSVRLA